MVVSSGLRSILRRAMRNETHDYQHPIHWFRTLGSSPSSPFSTWRNSNNNRKNNKARMDDKKSDWWIVDGEMHETGENVPPRERFVIPRDNLPNKRRKQMREQFMRRTRLVLKESEHEPFCKRYIELYQELRENWERLYWDEGYSKKLAQDHANYESAEDDDLDFSPYRKRRAQPEQPKDQGFRGSRVDDTREKVGQIRDKFEFDRERRMREKAFAPMHRGTGYNFCNSGAKNQSFDTAKYFPQFERN